MIHPHSRRLSDNSHKYLSQASLIFASITALFSIIAVAICTELHLHLTFVGFAAFASVSWIISLQVTLPTHIPNQNSSDADFVITDEPILPSVSDKLSIWIMSLIASLIFASAIVAVSFFPHRNPSAIAEYVFFSLFVVYLLLYISVISLSSSSLLLYVILCHDYDTSSHE